MANNHALTVVLFLVAVAVLMQGGAMVGIWLAIRRMQRELEAVRADLKQRLDPLTQSVGEILTNSREPVRAIVTNLAEISRILRDRTSRVDEAVGELVDRSRLQISRVDQMVSDLVQKIETTADTVQRSVLSPIHEVSAVVKGVRSGLEFLFSRRRTPSVSEATQDEQLFI